MTFCTDSIFKKYPKIAILPPDRGKITIYGSDFQQLNLTPNGGVSPTDYRDKAVDILYAFGVYTLR